MGESGKGRKERVRRVPAEAGFLPGGKGAGEVLRIGEEGEEGGGWVGKPLLGVERVAHGGTCCCYSAYACRRRAVFWSAVCDLETVKSTGETKAPFLGGASV